MGFLLEAAVKMGMGDCSQSVTPKFGLLAAFSEQGHILARYFMPWETHPTMAVTGSQAMASCALTPNTVANGMMSVPDERPAKVTLHHPMGEMVVVVDYKIENGVFQHQSAGLIRTCRKLAQGQLFVPSSALAG